MIDIQQEVDDIKQAAKPVRAYLAQDEEAYTTKYRTTEGYVVLIRWYKQPVVLDGSFYNVYVSCSIDQCESVVTRLLSQPSLIVNPKDTMALDWCCIYRVVTQDPEILLRALDVQERIRETPVKGIVF